MTLRLRAGLARPYKRLASYTDIDRREHLRAENVAVLLRVGVTYQEGLTWQRAHAAHRELWEVFNERERVEHPRAFALFDEARRAYTRRLKRAERRRARRATRPAIAPAVSSTLRAAA